MADTVSLVIARDDRLERGPDGRANAQRQKLRARLGERLMHIALDDASGASARLWRIGRSASGRPFACGAPPDAGHLEVSLTHSGGFLAAAASGCTALAVDVEVTRERHFTDLARQLPWPASCTDTALTCNRFYQLWTLWEATLKLPGGPGEPQRALFAALAHVLPPGVPGTAAAAGGFAQSWLCPDRFWLTVVSLGRRAPRMRLLAVAAWGRPARLVAHEAGSGTLAAPAVARHLPLC